VLEVFLAREDAPLLAGGVLGGGGPDDDEALGDVGLAAREVPVDVPARGQLRGPTVELIERGGELHGRRAGAEGEGDEDASATEAGHERR
jgi:hypothetical protein